MGRKSALIEAGKGRWGKLRTFRTGKLVRIFQEHLHVRKEEKFLLSCIWRECWPMLFLGKAALQLESGEKGYR